MTYPKFPSIPRLNKPVIISEKIDGSNGQILVQRATLPLVEKFDLSPVEPVDYVSSDGVGYNIYAGSRNRWLGAGPNKPDNFGFAAWVQANSGELVETLGEGSHYGEWWGPGIQRGYGIAERRFSLFNTSRWMDLETTDYGLSVVPVLGVHDGRDLTYAVNTAMISLETNGSVASPGFMRPEGVVAFHTAANQPFKVTFDNPEGKWTA